jgi:[ribosomal protein S18]-alanine N-acetyltransferase
MDGVTIRDYRAGDWDAMYALDVQCFEPPFRFSRRAMRGFAEAAGSITLLAMCAGQLAGFCVVQMEDQLGYVVTLDVAADWRRRGLARLLMEEVEGRVRAEHGTAMALHVFEGNIGAVRFYEAIGYRRIAVANGFYGRDVDALVYERTLGA